MGDCHQPTNTSLKLVQPCWSVNYKYLFGFSLSFFFAVGGLLGMWWFPGITSAFFITEAAFSWVIFGIYLVLTIEPGYCSVGTIDLGDVESIVVETSDGRHRILRSEVRALTVHGICSTGNMEVRFPQIHLIRLQTFNRAAATSFVLRSDAAQELEVLETFLLCWESLGIAHWQIKVPAFNSERLFARIFFDPGCWRIRS
jgi:hypothetical protein